MFKALCSQLSNIFPILVLFRMLIKKNCSMPPAALATSHVQASKVLKVDAKIAVPTQKNYEAYNVEFDEAYNPLFRSLTGAHLGYVLVYYN